MNYPLVIFDWDGTLMDSIGKIVNCVTLAAENLAVQVPGENAVKDIIGLSLDKAMETLFPEHAHHHAALVEGYKNAYLHQDATPTPLFDDVCDTLATLKSRGFTLAVATGKSRVGLDRLMEETGLGAYFSYSRTGDEAQSKPSPDMLNQLLSESGFGAHQAIMIGDTHTDMKMAKAANMAAIGVTFGVHDKERLLNHGPIATVDGFGQLLGLL